MKACRLMSLLVASSTTGCVMGDRISEIFVVNELDQPIEVRLIEGKRYRTDRIRIRPGEQKFLRDAFVTSMSPAAIHVFIKNEVYEIKTRREFYSNWVYRIPIRAAELTHPISPLNERNSVH